MAKKQYGEALNSLEEALKLAPDSTEALGAIARVHIVQGTPKAAFARVEQGLKGSKNPAGLYQLLGEISFATRDYGRAIEFLEKAVNLNPELTSAYYMIGNAYAAQKRFDTALDQYQKIVKKTPNAIPAYMMIGTLYDLQKQPAKANEVYQKVLDINKGFVPAANNLAWNYAEHGGNIDIALTMAQKAREARSDDPAIADTLGWVHFKKKSYPTAIALLKESSEKFKNSNPTVLYHLAQAFDKNGEEEMARQSVTKALALNTEFAELPEAKKLLASLGGK